MKVIYKHCVIGVMQERVIKMAKNFPYFKFIATDWLTGDIVFESLSAQGLFINICAIYWQRDGVLTIDEVNKRYKSPNELKELSESFLNIKDGFINIQFLDEQLIDANHKSKVNAENGAKGGLKKKANAKRTLTKRLANFSKEEEEQEEEQEEDLLIFENIDKSTWLKWTNYKSSQFKFKYKSKESEQTAINSLIELSGNSGLTALRIIDQSISNGWSGLFELKTKKETISNLSKNEQRFNKFQEASDGAAAIIRAKYGIEEDS